MLVDRKVLSIPETRSGWRTINMLQTGGTRDGASGDALKNLVYIKAYCIVVSDSAKADIDRVVLGVL